MKQGQNKKRIVIQVRLPPKRGKQRKEDYRTGKKEFLLLYKTPKIEVIK